MIPVANPFVGGKEKIYVNEALEAGELSGNFGTFIGKFEQKFADFCGSNHAVTVSSGTAALHVAVEALEITEGDEVLVQTLTNMATAFAVSYSGATPVPIDIDPYTWNIDVHKIEQKINSKTKAIIVVHIFGQPVDMDAVMAIAKKHGLFVIEDCAEAHGATINGRKVGSIGHIGCFSFYANKIITTGEGGMLTTNDPELAAKMKSLKSLCYGTSDNKFDHDRIGFNYRMPNIIAAIGCAQMDYLDENINRKIEIAKFYDKAFSGLSQVIQTPPNLEGMKAVFWVYHIVLKGKLAGKRKHFMGALRDVGIETRETFWPLDLQRVYKKGLNTNFRCPVAQNVGENGLYLPSGPVISIQDLEYVSKKVREIVTNLESS